MVLKKLLKCIIIKEEKKYECLPNDIMMTMKKDDRAIKELKEKVKKLSKAYFNGDDELFIDDGRS